MDPHESMAVFAIAATVVMSFVYFLLLGKIKPKTAGETLTGMVSLYGWRKISGFLLLGVLPAVSAWFMFRQGPLQLGLAWGDTAKVWPWIAGASVFFVVLNIFNSKNSDLRAVYPEMRIRRWDLSLLGIGAGGWLLYLAAYEYLFRGILLFGCYKAFGLWPAVVINLALYSALHLPKGMKEAMAAIPFGALICYLTLQSHSILPAIFLHFLQAFSCEICCIFRSPEMEFNFLKKVQP